MIKNMKVLLINGSPRSNGNTFTALKEVAGALEAEGVETEIVPIGAKAVQGCTLGRSIAWVLKGLKTQPLPGKEPSVKTNFVR